MTELEIAGIGIWSPFFSDWSAFCTGINSGEWQTDAPLKPGLIPPRERRRAPQSVKMALEVMDQACEMASLDPVGAATVFSSSMGDLQITDYLCKILASTPGLVSPTRFHNSVHNASTGYWSIARHTHAPSNAVSAMNYTAPMAFLEAAIQAVEEDVPVLLVSQEMAAPKALHVACPSDYPISMAMVLTKPGLCSGHLASIRFGSSSKHSEEPELPGDLESLYGRNFGAKLLPLAAAIASQGVVAREGPNLLEFPLSRGSSLSISLT